MEQNKGFTIGNWISEGKRIGKGAFATVFLGHHKDRPAEPVAIKVVDVERLTRSNQKLKKHLDSEINIMRSLRHDNIVTLHEVYVGTEYIYLILEYCEGGDFSEFLKQHKRLSEDKARYYLRQLAAGLKYLHSRNIVHRDLKPQNLLMAKSTNSSPDGMPWDLKIADFGFARFIEPQSVASTLCGSPLYMAPEVLLCQPYDAKADLWSVGAILYEMLVGSPPFNVRTHIELVRILVSEPVKFPRNLGVSHECMDLLQSLLKKNKEERITWREFFSHPFIIQQEAPTPPISFKTSNPRAIPNATTSTNHRKRSATIGSAPTNVGNMLPPSPPMAVGSPIAASLPLHRMDNNFTSPPRQNIPQAMLAGHYTFISPSSLPHNLSSSPSNGGFGDGSYHSPPFSASPHGASPTFSPSSSPTSMYIRQLGSAEGNAAFGRSPNSSGGFGEGFGSGGWNSGPRKPLTNPFKESVSPVPSMVRSKEKESIGSADDSFELLDPTSDSSSSQISREDVVDELEARVRKAATVVELGDSKVDVNPAEALGLYIKALHIYHSISQRAKVAAQTQSLTASSRLGVVVERMKAEFNSTLKKAEYLKRNLKPNDTCPPAEKSIYDSALQMGRDGAVAEVLRNFGKAESLYVRSTQLLQLLSDEARHASDKSVLDSYIASFEKRLTEVRKKQTIDETVGTTSLTVTSE